MCFSAQASFSVGTLLLGIGALSWRAAHGRGERAFAAIPALFALQQFIEGLLWLSVSHDAPQLGVAMTYAFSFFSHLFWPVYVPLAVLLIEPRRPRQQAVFGCALLGLAVSSWLLLSMSEYGVVAQVHSQHIEYVSSADLGPLTMLSYLVSTSISPLISSHRTVRAFGALALLSFFAAYLVYSVWFISVWCYFAALLSAVVLVHFKGRRPVPLTAGRT
ncbi:MAG: hypothetical protein B7Y51_02040 [Burkholderiales bacterium 28-67-8]|nr:MAG: hypothetical protein B7Y51_02040 [Burkholderiales bacterium 28-67-8]